MRWWSYAAPITCAARTGSGSLPSWSSSHCCSTRGIRFWLGAVVRQRPRRASVSTSGAAVRSLFHVDQGVGGRTRSGAGTPVHHRSKAQLASDCDRLQRALHLRPGLPTSSIRSAEGGRLRSMPCVTGSRTWRCCRRATGERLQELRARDEPPAGLAPHRFNESVQRKIPFARWRCHSYTATPMPQLPRRHDHADIHHPPGPAQDDPANSRFHRPGSADARAGADPKTSRRSSARS